MLRICLIIAIVAGLAAAGLGFVKVGGVIKDTMTERDTYHKSADDEKAAKDKAVASLKKAQGELDTTKKTLATTESDLKAATAKAEELDKAKTDLTAQLERTKTDRDAAQQELSKWTLLNVKPEEVKTLIENLKNTIVQRDTFVSENKILFRKITELNSQIESITDPDRPVPLPAGLRGKVIAVDPKFDFVVLDIGGDSGVLTHGEMLVSRQGKLIAKVRIADVKTDRSVANILPGWKKAEVMEGDQVLTQIY